MVLTAAKALTGLIAFKHTFILIIHLFSGIRDFALCTCLSSKKKKKKEAN